MTMDAEHKYFPWTPGRCVYFPCIFVLLLAIACVVAMFEAIPDMVKDNPAYVKTVEEYEYVRNQHTCKDMCYSDDCPMRSVPQPCSYRSRSFGIRIAGASCGATCTASGFEGRMCANGIPMEPPTTVFKSDIDGWGLRYAGIVQWIPGSRHVIILVGQVEYLLVDVNVIGDQNSMYHLKKLFAD